MFQLYLLNHYIYGSQAIHCIFTETVLLSWHLFFIERGVKRQDSPIRVRTVLLTQQLVSDYTEETDQREEMSSTSSTSSRYQKSHFHSEHRSEQQLLRLQASRRVEHTPITFQCLHSTNACSWEAFLFTINIGTCRAQALPRSDGFPLAMAIACARLLRLIKYHGNPFLNHCVRIH